MVKIESPPERMYFVFNEQSQQFQRTSYHDLSSGQMCYLVEPKHWSRKGTSIRAGIFLESTEEAFAEKNIGQLNGDDPLYIFVEYQKYASIEVLTEEGWQESYSLLSLANEGLYGTLLPLKEQVIDLVGSIPEPLAPSLLTQFFTAIRYHLETNEIHKLNDRLCSSAKHSRPRLERWIKYRALRDEYITTEQPELREVLLKLVEIRQHESGDDLSFDTALNLLVRLDKSKDTTLTLNESSLSAIMSINSGSSRDADSNAMHTAHIEYSMLNTSRRRVAPEDSNLRANVTITKNPY